MRIKENKKKRKMKKYKQEDKGGGGEYVRCSLINPHAYTIGSLSFWGDQFLFFKKILHIPTRDNPLTERSTKSNPLISHTIDLSQTIGKDIKKKKKETFGVTLLQKSRYNYMLILFLF